MTPSTDPPLPRARVDWCSLSDTDLLAQCARDQYRASGPGGQKRNKTDSAVRLRHLPTGMLVTATESRSSHENLRRAVRRMRTALALRHRQPVAQLEAAERALVRAALEESNPKGPCFLPAAALILDCLAARRGKVGEVAEAMEVSTARLARFLHLSRESWRAAQEIRAANDLAPLR